MDEEEVKNIRNLVYEVMDLKDYCTYFTAREKGDFSSVILLAQKYLDDARNAFFASLEKDICDVNKAKSFHSAYKVYEEALEFLALDLPVEAKILPS